ncbi:MAG: hypothetical protein PHX78_07315 [bacterium]|nr:hypothetical protein [bacterium]
MLKKGLALFLIIFFQIIFVSNLRAQGESIKTDNKETAAEEKKNGIDKDIKPGVEEKVKKEIRGKITEIAEDETYLKIGDIKIITSKQFLKDSFVSVGDNIEIMAEETPKGLKALDYKYIYDEQNDSSSMDDDLSVPEQFEIDVRGE